MKTAGKRPLIIPVSDRLFEEASWKGGRTGNTRLQGDYMRLTYKVLMLNLSLQKSICHAPFSSCLHDILLFSFILMSSHCELIFLFYIMPIACSRVSWPCHYCWCPVGLCLCVCVVSCPLIFTFLHPCLTQTPRERLICLCFQNQCGAYLLFRPINQYISRWVPEKLDKSMLACWKIASEVHV